jgi:hypothetical protein
MLKRSTTAADLKHSLPVPPAGGAPLLRLTLPQRLVGLARRIFQIAAWFFLGIALVALCIVSADGSEEGHFGEVMLLVCVGAVAVGFPLLLISILIGRATAGWPQPNTSLALRGVVISARDRLALIVRYALTRPLAYQAVGIVGVAYTVVVAIDDETALMRWLLGLVIALVGRGMTLVAPKTSASDTYGRDLYDPVGLLLGWLPLPAARRAEFVMGAILIVAGLAIAISSVFAL